MFKSPFQLNIKHLCSFFVTLVLFIALNVNTFAVSSYTVNFYDSNYVCTAVINGKATNVTSLTKLTDSGTKVSPLNNRHYVSYSFNSSQSSQTSIATGADLGLYTNTQYKYDFGVRFIGGTKNHERNINVFITFANDAGDSDIVQLYSGEKVSQEWINCSGTFVTPNMTGNVVCAMVIQLGQLKTESTTTNNFICNLTDMSVTVDSPLYGESINTPDDSKLQEVIGDYNEISDQLPKLDKDQIDGILNFDFSGFTDGMQFVRDLFDKITSSLGITSVLVFALSMGLVTYILGRRVS